VKLTRGGETLDRRDATALGAEGGDEAAVDGDFVEPDRARPTVACVTSLLDSEAAELAQ
jgi:hypothetical protein